MTTRFANLWMHPGALGGKPIFHLSRLYESDVMARLGALVAPDAGWWFVRTFAIDIDDLAANASGEERIP